jgi:hypothetical protein
MQVWAAGACAVQQSGEVGSDDHASGIFEVPEPRAMCENAAQAVQDQGSETNAPPSETGDAVIQDCTVAITPFAGAFQNLPTTGNPAADAVVITAAVLISAYAFLRTKYQLEGIDLEDVVVEALDLDGARLVAALLLALTQLHVKSAGLFLSQLPIAKEFAQTQVGQAIAMYWGTRTQDVSAFDNFVDEELFRKGGSACGSLCRIIAPLVIAALVVATLTGSIQQLIDGDDDSQQRDAYVLGAGQGPTVTEQGAFLLMLSQHYRKVYVNDIDPKSLSVDMQRVVSSDYHGRCDAARFKPSPDFDASGKPVLDLCQIVTSVPQNLDFRWMGQPASAIPPLSNADVFVVYPSPNWFYGSMDDSSGGLGFDLLGLLGPGSTAYVVSEYTLTHPNDHRMFWSQGLNLERFPLYFLNSIDIRRFDSEHEIVPAVAFTTLSGNLIYGTSIHMSWFDSAILYRIQRL